MNIQYFVCVIVDDLKFKNAQALTVTQEDYATQICQSIPHGNASMERLFVVEVITLGYEWKNWHNLREFETTTSYSGIRICYHCSAVPSDVLRIPESWKFSAKFSHKRNHLQCRPRASSSIGECIKLPFQSYIGHRDRMRNGWAMKPLIFQRPKLKKKMKNHVWATAAGLTLIRNIFVEIVCTIPKSQQNGNFSENRLVPKPGRKVHFRYAHLGFSKVDFCYTHSHALRIVNGQWETI